MDQSFAHEAEDEEVDLDDVIGALELEEFRELLEGEGLAVDAEMAAWLQQLITTSGSIEDARRALARMTTPPEAA
jgi:hypothetical protein